MRSTKEIDKAFEVAKNDLRSNYGEYGILAGRGQFSDYWARDSFFASFGALELGDFDIVKKNLSLFLEHTKKDGTVPLRIGVYNIIPKIVRNVFGYRIRGKSFARVNRKIDKLEKNVVRSLQARYVNDRNSNFSLDANSLLLVSFYYYLKKSGDKEFARKHFPLLRKVLEKSFGRDKDNNLLLENVSGGTWDDSLNIGAESIYANICHVSSIRSIWKIAKIIGHKSAKKYEESYHRVKSRINYKLWNGEFYSKSILGTKKMEVFSTAGNLLAIHWHISDKDQAVSIQDKVKEFGINRYVPSLTNFPKYPKGTVAFLFRLFGISDYHDMGMCWLWLGCEDAIVKYKLGFRKRALEVMCKMSKVINRHGVVFEVYEKNGEPVNRFFYRSESSFAWSSGLFVLAYGTLFSRKRDVIKWSWD